MQNQPDRRSKEQPPLEKCPRCDSINTKFCYYNNYSLSQPRHFCRSCRRYWTRGGSLRNVPIGGGSRRPRKPRTSSFSSADSFPHRQPHPYIPPSSLDATGAHSTVPDFKDIPGSSFGPGFPFPSTFGSGDLYLSTLATIKSSSNSSHAFSPSECIAGGTSLFQMQASEEPSLAMQQPDFFQDGRSIEPLFELSRPVMAGWNDSFATISASRSSLWCLSDRGATACTSNPEGISSNVINTDRWNHLP